MKFIFVFIFGIVGCAVAPTVHNYESKANGIKIVEVDPGWVGSGGFKIGLNRNDKMPPGTAYVVVAWRDIPESKSGLVVNIDGKKSEFSSDDLVAEVDQYGFFRKMFLMKLEFVREMVSGRSVWVSVTNHQHTFSEGEFSKDIPLGARNGFSAFLASIDGLSPKR